MVSYLTCFQLFILYVLLDIHIFPKKISGNFYYTIFGQQSRLVTALMKFHYFLYRVVGN